MFGIGPQETFVILLLILLLFGANRIPEVARSLGRGMHEFRKAANEFQRAIEEEPAPKRAPGSPAIAAATAPGAAPPAASGATASGAAPAPAPGATAPAPPTPVPAAHALPRPRSPMTSVENPAASKEPPPPWSEGVSSAVPPAGSA